MREETSEAALNRLVKQATAKRHIPGAVFNVSSENSNTDVVSASGNMNEDSRYYIASVNKLFISALILRLDSSGKLSIDDRISSYLDRQLVQGLHSFRGVDYSDSLTITHLMSHTSGLPCYLADRQANGRVAMSELQMSVDQAWPKDKVIQTVKSMKTHFPPGMKGKAQYSDTNYRILGMVLEEVTGKPVKVVLDNLFRELGMMQTRVCDDSRERNFVPIRYKSGEIQIPQFLTSTGDDIISTAGDQMAFLKSFFDGHFFPRERLPELEIWNKIFFPFKYGIGLQKFSLPRVLSPFHHVPEMIGHCGSTGSVAFYVPILGRYITGTVNQQSRPNVAFQTTIKIMNRLGH